MYTITGTSKTGYSIVTPSGMTIYATVTLKDAKRVRDYWNNQETL